MATVGEVMASPVVTVEPTVSVLAARQLMSQRRIRHLAVADRGLLVGILSERDLGDAPDDMLPVRQVMSAPVLVAAPDMPVRRAARLLAERRLGALLVLHGREIVGIVSVVDLLRGLGEQRDMVATAG